jgi:diguanylate cyclase
MIHQQSAATSTPPDDFTWRSNPLDWRPIDRLILLAALVLIAPLLFGTTLLAALLLAPDYLMQGTTCLLLGLYAIHGLLLGSYLVLALRRRHQVSDWPALENFIISSFVVNVMASSYATGTHFTEGLLLIFLGINITSALANIRKIHMAYVFVCIVMMLFAVIDFSGALAPAPLLARSILEADGSPVVGWLVVQVLIAAILLAISHISMSAISRWVEREDLYREMSTIDGLTRLTNRRSFIERGQSELSRARRIATGGVSCVMVDLDHFKRVNDTWGHHAGDQVLVAASAILMESARQYDEVGRYGGEEFAILVPGVSLQAAADVAERIREKIATTTVEVDGNSISMSASFGVACYPAQGIDDLNDLLKAADKALYIAKENGRNRVVMADQST